MRFDLAVACAALFTGLFISWGMREIKETQHIIIYTSLICGIPWFVGCKLWIESHELSRKYFYLIGVPIFTLIAYYFYGLPNNIFLPRITLFASLCSFIFISPFILTHQSSDDVWSFHFRLIRNSILANLSSVILLIGAVLILMALDYLLSFKFYSDQYGDISTFISFFMFPLLVMIGIPNDFQYPSLPKGEILLKLLVYILIPLLLIYGLILHIYAIKIFISGELPRGKVAYLVAGFSSWIVIVYILAQRWKDDQPIIKFFHNYVGWFMIIPLSLMVWGIWERLSTFGLTEPRYLLCAFAIWLIISTFLILSRLKNASIGIIAAFSGLALIISAGPWGVVELPVKHQLYRLKTVLLNINTHPKHVASYEQKLIVASILDYLELRNRLEDLITLKLIEQNTSIKKLSAKTASKMLNVPYIEKKDRKKSPSYK